MICPICRAQLPARFAFATSLNTVTCRHCASELRPTADSAGVVARKTFFPFAALGVALGSGGVWFGLSTGRWVPLWTALSIGLVASLVVSWRVALKHYSFERA
jgi:hypothetical protein